MTHKNLLKELKTLSITLESESLTRTKSKFIQKVEKSKTSTDLMLRHLILSKNSKEQLMLQKELISEFFSIANQYFLNCSQTTCKPELTITDNCLAPIINLYLYEFL